MFYRNIPIIIPILAAGYLLLVYLLLVLARRTNTADMSRSRD